MKAFEAKYPGVKVEVYRSQSSDLGKRIMTENKAKPLYGCARNHAAASEASA